MQTEGEDSFVSISLEGSECEICLQDTGEHLTTCDICARHLTRHLTRGPVQEGFNQIPDLVHAETRGHSACFRKFHKLARRLGRNGGSPKHREEAGASAAAVACSNASAAGSVHGVKAEYTGSSTLGDYRQPFTSAPRDSRPPLDSTITQRPEREQWLNFNTNNLGSELLLENIRNRVSRSNPGSRRASPVFSGTGSRPLLDQERCRSDPELDISSTAQELRRSYAKYLYGGRREDEESEDLSLESLEKPFARLKQNVKNTGEAPFEQVSKLLEKPCLTKQVPEDRDIVGEETFVVPEQCNAKSNDKSCLSNLQYLEPMHGSTLDQCHELARDYGTRAQKFEQKNNRTDSDRLDTDNSSGLMDSRKSEIVRDVTTKRGSRKCDIGNQNESEIVRKNRSEPRRKIGLCNDSDVSVTRSMNDIIGRSDGQTDSNKFEIIRRNGSDHSALKVDAPCESQEGEGLRAADWWRDIGRIDNDQLYMMSSEQLRTHVQSLRRAVNDAGSQLVQLLQEKDIIGSEVSSRHVTIKKLVQRQTNLHH